MMSNRIWAYGLLLLALSLSGCRKGIVMEEGTPIRFGVSEVMVKAEFVSPNGADYLIKQGNKASVYGTWTGSSTTETVFNGVTLTCESASSWTYDNALTRNWKNSGTYHFKAVFPIREDVGSSSNGTHLTVPYSMHTEAGNVDLMVASVSRDMSEGYLGPVDLVFQHATSAIRFLFRKGESTSADYKLEMLEMQHLRTVGELILEADDLTENNPLTNDSWYLASSYRPEAIHHWEAEDESQCKPIGDTYTSFTGYDWYFCIPQDLTVSAEESHPAVHFRVKMTGGVSVENTLEIPDTDIHGDPVRWEPGKVYTYYIGVTPQTSSVYVRVNSWDAAYVSVDEIIFD
jgi:hypothetical protein